MADLDTNSSTCGTEAQVDSIAVEVTSKGSEKELVFSEDEEILITRMFNLVGERWSLIAGRIPGRTAEEIEKYWNSRYSTSQ
ncbi:PREDICTED: MYB-like transcription factor ETC1 isoform X1 [Ipomoea nil]|uniref:MYB-like transcription factor ETC1 isoform X1 n=1 Tax=Ipomoea nil TaxID=35883 RepID=UPI0009010520|nr:PREDICTED: MYB-like transcription factor ETC1 isoform X1 [Ipomoea nil]